MGLFSEPAIPYKVSILCSKTQDDLKSAANIQIVPRVGETVVLQDRFGYYGRYTVSSVIHRFAENMQHIIIWAAKVSNDD